MNERKVALLTGITGQDGSYLAELLGKGYTVHGIVRRASTHNTDRIDHLLKDPHETDACLHLHYGDLADSSNLRRILDVVRPTEVYNLGAQSHVQVSFEAPAYTADVVAVGTIRLLEALRQFQRGADYQVRFFQAGSSEMFGKVTQMPQNESTPFYPRSPYGVAKVSAYWSVVNYREAYNLHLSNGIAFNHESPRRGEHFVTRKITRAIGRIKHRLQKKLYLGNIEAHRDWGFAGDFVDAMWRMLQKPEPGDYVIATGRQYAVSDFLQRAFDYVGLDWHDFVEIDPELFRPAEVDTLLGDASLARKVLGWEPRVSFDELVGMMVEHDLEMAAREKTLLDAGHELPGRRH